MHLTRVPDDVLTTITEAVAAGLPEPTHVVACDDEDGPFLNLRFSVNDSAAVDAWAKHVHARVDHTDWTYGEVDADDNPIGAPCHEYGTAAPEGRLGTWLDRAVGLGCEILGPHPRGIS